MNMNGQPRNLYCLLSFWLQCHFPPVIFAFLHLLSLSFVSNTSSAALTFCFKITGIAKHYLIKVSWGASTRQSAQAPSLESPQWHHSIPSVLFPGLFKHPLCIRTSQV